MCDNTDITFLILNNSSFKFCFPDNRKGFGLTAFILTGNFLTSAAIIYQAVIFSQFSVQLACGFSFCSIPSIFSLCFISRFSAAKSLISGFDFARQFNFCSDKELIIFQQIFIKFTDFVSRAAELLC